MGEGVDRSLVLAARSDAFAATVDLRPADAVVVPTPTPSST
jgi:hypothetical protein